MLNPMKYGKLGRLAKGQPDIRESAIRFTMGVLRRARDWQDGQDALSNHDEFGPWLEAGGDPVAEAQSIIREAEERLGDDLPY